jgi:hypothetical protein
MSKPIITPCCDALRELLSGDSYGGTNPALVYEDGWHIAGCCYPRYEDGRGGCYVAHDLKFCPFCTAALPIPDRKNA